MKSTEVRPEDYLMCTVDGSTDFWKYDYDKAATGCSECNTIRPMTQEEFERQKAECFENGCFEDSPNFEGA